MPFNVSSFKANIASEGYQKNNTYEVIIAPPPIIASNIISNVNGDYSVNEITNNLKFRTTKVTLPGIEMKTVNARRYGMGPMQKYTTTNEYTEMRIEILCDKFGSIWQFWYHWLRSVFEFSGNSDSRTGNINTFPSYMNNYKDDITSTILLIVFNQEGEPTMRFDILEAFPVALSEANFAWADGGLTQLAVTFNYKEYRIIGSDLEQYNMQ